MAKLFGLIVLGVLAGFCLLVLVAGVVIGRTEWRGRDGLP